MFQIYSPPRYIQKASFNKITQPNLVHQSDLELTYDEVNEKLYMWCLTIVDVASRYKEAYPLTSKNSSEVSNTFERIYNDSSNPLNWPRLLQVSWICSTLMERHNVTSLR